jgi:hypothetical protein
MKLPDKFLLFSLLALLGSIALIGVGCGGKTIQYPEDHERYLRIDRAVESLRQAYVKKDSSDLASLMIPIDDDPGLRQRGHTRLQWVGTQSILLRGVQGDAPFGMKARQATTDSTRSPNKK